MRSPPQPETMSAESAISLLSSLLQVVVGFAGLIVVAYVFLDETLRNTDQERKELNKAWRIRFFGRLRPLLYFTLLVALVAAATLTFLHGPGPLSRILTLWVDVVALLSFLMLLFIIRFAIRILDPEGLTKVAEQEVDRESEREIAPLLNEPQQLKDSKLPAREFLDKYRTLETQLMDRLGTTDIRQLTGAELSSALEAKKVLSESDIKKVLALRRIRNLLVHGRAQRVDGRSMTLLGELLSTLGANENHNPAIV
jgi:hypothetical protein